MIKDGDGEALWRETIVGQCVTAIGLGRFNTLQLFPAPFHTHNHEKKSIAASTGQHTHLSS